MRWACTSHRSHSFDVRIIDCNSGKGKGKSSAAQYVTCELAITHDSSSYASKSPLRLEIEQACESDHDEHSFQQTEKHDTNAQLLTETTLRKNAVRMDVVPQTVAKPSAGSFPQRFRKREQPLRDVRPSSIDPHAQWFTMPLASQHPLGTSQSLSDLIRWISENPIPRSLSRRVLIETAGNLAEGIMQFYSTPWPTPSNLGENVRYFNPAACSATSVHLEGPYFMARLESTRASRGTRMRTRCAPCP